MSRVEACEGSDDAVDPALVGAHSHFPTLVRAAMAFPSLRRFGPVTRKLASGRRLDLRAFAEEVAFLVEVSIARADLEGHVTPYVESGLDPDDDLGCDFKGSLLEGAGRIVTFSSGEENAFFPVHVFCRRDGSIFVAVMEEDDALTFSAPHTLERSEALVACLVATLARLFPRPTLH